MAPNPIFGVNVVGRTIRYPVIGACCIPNVWYSARKSYDGTLGAHQEGRRTEERLRAEEVAAAG